MKDGEKEIWRKGTTADKPADSAGPGEDTALIKPEVQSEIFYVDDNGDKILNEDAILTSDWTSPHGLFQMVTSKPKAYVETSQE